MVVDKLSLGEMAPRAIARVVAAVEADAGVYHVGDDVDVGDGVAVGGAPGRTKHGTVLDLADDVLNSLPDAVELAVELVVACSQATRHAPLNVLGQHMWA